MLLIEYLILGILQGFTEPLPISSSGHLRILKYIFNNEVLSDINFEIIVNFGSLIAIIILYKHELIHIIKDFFLYLKTKENKYKTNYIYSYLIIIGTIPCVIIGIFVKDFIENYFSIKFIGLMFILTSILLYMIKDISGYKNKKDIKIYDAIKIGIFQTIALLPGISRSGATLVGAMKCNIKKEDAINFSFMLYIPISIGSFILGIKDIINLDNLNIILIPYIVSMIVSSFATYYSAKLFINTIKKGKLIYFSIYCFLLGILTIIIF